MTNALYAMMRALQINLEIKQPLRKGKNEREQEDVRKIKKQRKELRQVVEERDMVWICTKENIAGKARHKDSERTQKKGKQ